MVNKDVRRMRAAALPDGTPDTSPAAQAGMAADLDRPVDVLVFEVRLGDTFFVDCTTWKDDAPAARLLPAFRSEMNKISFCL